MTNQVLYSFSCRIVTSDYYLTPPVKDLDACFSDLTSSAVERVPVIRIFGATPAGQKCCLHVHGVFPYIHIPCPKKTGPVDEAYLQQLARSIDSALQISAGTTKRKLNYVYKIIVVKGMWVELLFVVINCDLPLLYVALSMVITNTRSCFSGYTSITPP